ncbi:ER membrane protein complex subunit 1 [Pleurotus pulmonarius]
MRLGRLASSLALVFPVAFALHESDVGVVDWHKKLIGVPLTSSSATAPVFHRVGEETTHSVILTATASNVLAAIFPENGTVAWRYIYESGDNIASFYLHKNVVASLSGPGGATLRTFDILNGDLLLEQRIHEPSHGQLYEPSYLGTSVAYTADGSDLVVLSNGGLVQRLDNLGAVKWSWSSSDPSALVIFSKVVTTTTHVYVIGLSKTPSSYKLHVAVLSSGAGELVQLSDISSSITAGLNDLMVVRRADEVLVVWLEQGSLKYLTLSPNLHSSPTAVKGSAFKRIVDVGLGEYGQFLAVKDDGSSRIFKLDGSVLKSVWEFSASGNRHADPIYSGGRDKKGNPYIAQVRWSHALNQAAVDVYTGHLGKGVMTAYTFPFDTQSHGIITHATLDCVNPSEMTVVSRLVITTSTGALQLWQQNQHQWTREESLSTVAVAEFVELPEKVDISHIPKERETFGQRLQRQIMEAQDFPQYALKFVKRFATGSYASASSAAVAPDSAGKPYRDAFGFRQVIVVATPYSKVFGIDSSNGEILWSRMFGLGWAAETGGSILPVKLYVTQTVHDGDSPQVVIVAQRRAENTLIDTVIYHIDASSGENVAPGVVDKDVLEGVDIISGPLVESFILPDHKAVVMLDEFLQVYLYPDTKEATASFTKLAPSLHFPLRVNVDGQRRLVGQQVSLNAELSDRFVAHPTWTLSIPPSEDIQTLLPASHEPIASFGKVLGNRTTLYKYLNPRMFALLTAPKATQPASCAIYLVDSAKGSVLHRTSVPASRGVCDVHMSLVENWFSYYYYDPEFTGVGQSKGHRMVTIELYEGSQVDEKTKSSELSAFSDKLLDVSTFEQAYIFPHGVTALSTTSTKFGISTKDLIVATKNHKILSIPRRVLNPRRPNRKVTAEEQEEQLIPYDPLIPDDPRRTLSHNYEVANVRRIVTAPALLESTSLVFAYGLDLFFTRVAPSNTFDVLNENFNKGQLVVTVTGLAVAIMITRPMVKRKRLRERWYQ